MRQHHSHIVCMSDSIRSIFFCDFDRKLTNYLFDRSTRKTKITCTLGLVQIFEICYNCTLIESTNRPNIFTTLHCSSANSPSSSSPEQIISLLDSGMNVARLNFSHGSHESHLQVVNNLRTAMQMSGKTCAIMLDTKGPEIRTGLFPDGKSVKIKAGQELLIRCKKILIHFSAHRVKSAWIIQIFLSL